MLSAACTVNCAGHGAKCLRTIRVPYVRRHYGYLVTFYSNGEGVGFGVP